MPDGKQSPYFQPEETGQPAENDGEEQARQDYNDEREDKGDVDMEKPDWVKD